MMFQVITRTALILFVINRIITCDALRNFANREEYGSRYNTKYKESPPPKTLASSLPAQNPTRRGLGLSAWGIVTVIVSIIMAIVGMYYFSICYPVLCKKTRKYDMMGMPNVA